MYFLIVIKPVEDIAIKIAIASCLRFSLFGGDNDSFHYVFIFSRSHLGVFFFLNFLAF